MSSVLVVDDKEMMRDSVGSTLRRAGFEVVTAHNGPAALERIAQKRPDAVITDLKMPGLTGLELLEKIREIDDELPVVLMTAFGTIETAVHAIKLGAYDYITKPFEGDELLIAIKRAIAHSRVVRENALLRVSQSAAAEQGDASGPRSVTGLDRLIGDSPAMRRVKAQVEALAGSQGNVLIVGESGVGKEVVARAIHDLSSRAERPFLAVNCAALSESLLESELFGHEKGAFTGADRLRKGRFELADGGTLLLDEVSEVSPQIQAKLLRVLQERAFERVGSSLTIGVDVRVIATSNRDLPGAVEAGEFRHDLFFRLNVLPVHLPPLRDRQEDVAALARHFAGQVCRREGRPSTEFSDSALHLMRSYAWPGNVRELQNICERAVVLSQATGVGREGEIGRELVEPWLAGATASASVDRREASITETKPMPARLQGHDHAQDLRDNGSLDSESGSLDGERTLEEIEREAIVRTLHRFNGHRQKTAAALGIGVRTLGLKLKKWKEQELVAPTL